MVLACRGDRQSSVWKRRIAFQYAGDNPQTLIDAVGEVNFPNIEFDVAAVEFGCVLNDTCNRENVRITNTSKVDVVYSWSFLEEKPLLPAGKIVIVFKTLYIYLLPVSVIYCHFKYSRGCWVLLMFSSDF